MFQYQDQMFATNPIVENENNDNIPCKCRNPECAVKQMSRIQLDQIEHDYSFSKFFPDLFLKRVSLHYRLSDIYDIFNHDGNKIVYTITCIPRPRFTHYIVKFHSFKIPQESYDKFLCARWAIYKNPDIPAKIYELCGSEVYKFDDKLWNASPHPEDSVFEYHYPLFTNVCEFEEGEIDESSTAGCNDKIFYQNNTKKLDEYYNNYIVYGIAEHANEIQDLKVEEDVDVSVVSEDEGSMNNAHYSSDEDNYEYCEIIKGIWHRRRRYTDEDPDELQRRIDNAKTTEQRAEAFWDN